MKYDEFVELMNEESILACMKEIDEFSIPTIIDRFKRADEKNLYCKFSIDTTNFEKFRDRREVLSSLHLMRLLGTEVLDLFTSSGEVNHNVLDAKLFNIEIINIFQGLYKDFCSNMHLYYTTLGKISFDWYRIDEAFVKTLDIKDESVYTFSVQDFNKGDLFKKITDEYENIVEFLKEQTEKLADDKGVDANTWVDLYSDCQNIKNRIDVTSDTTILHVLNVCDIYLDKKLDRLRDYTEFVDIELLLASNVEEIRLYLHNEIRVYVNNIRDTLRATIDIRIDNMRLLQKHMKY